MTDLVRFNLLDWRGERRETRKQQFLTWLVAAGLIAIVVLGVLPYMYFNHVIGAQKDRNTYLQHQIDTADRKLRKIRDLKKTRDTIVNRMQVIEKLQNARPAIVHYFDQLAATIPKGVYVKSLDQKGDETTIDGVADANSDISAYMSNLAQSKWFESPRLIVIQHKKDNDQYAQFTLKIHSTHPDKPKGDASSGDGDSGQTGG